MIDTVLFDMDGVLVDSEPAHAAATSAALEAVGFDPLPLDEYDRYFYGRTDRAGFRDYLDRAGRTDVSLAEVIRRKADAYAAGFTDSVQPLADGLATLREAAAEGWQIAIVSSALAGEIALVVERFELDRYVQLTVSGEDVEHGKPNPQPYLLAAERLGRTPAQCLVIEDTPAGVAAARGAGMCCLAVDRLDQPERLAGADRIVTTVSLAAVKALAAECGGIGLP